MKLILKSLGALALTTTLAHAGGLDRSGQSITSIFETGGYAELSFGYIMPTVDKGVTALSPGVVSGNVANSYGLLGLAYKQDLNAKLSAALIMDQPFGASVSYDTSPGYFIEGTAAEVTTTSLTGLLRYKFNDAFSVHGGPRIVTATGFYNREIPAGGGFLDYKNNYGSDVAVGYVAGVAYEKPEIALRVALTYSSATDFNLAGSPRDGFLGVVGDLDARMPQSVNLDAQTGIAANTLLFGSVRWADWTDAQLLDSVDGDLVTYDQDVVTYSLGVGRKFSESFSGSVSVGYEKPQGGTVSDLSPTDGYTSLGVGGKYTRGNMEISGGVRYVWLGDATTDPVVSGVFTDNSAIGVGVKVAFRF